MSVFTSVGILLFSMLIMAFLQLVPGVFALFYHSLAGKFSKKHTELTALFFIFGVETALAVTILLVYSIINSSFAVLNFFRSNLFAWLISGVLLALALIFSTAYFRNSRGTELFISKSFKTKYLKKINSVKNHSDAFVLGFTSIIPELIFTLPLFLLSTLAILELGPTCLPRAALILLFVLASILPLLLLYAFFSHSSTLADYIRFRIKNKPFVRFFVTLNFCFLAILIILGATI